MLQFNAAASTLKKDDEIYKVLVLDHFTKGIIGPLLKLSDLRKQGVTLVLDLENQRESIPDVPAVYFVQATEVTISAISRDIASGLYDTFHLNFALACPRPLLETLASNTVASQCVQRIAKVYDQYLSFVALEAGLFSLGLPDMYVQLNDPQAQDTQIEVRHHLSEHSAVLLLFCCCIKKINRIAFYHLKRHALMVVAVVHGAGSCPHHCRWVVQYPSYTWHGTHHQVPKGEQVDKPYICCSQASIRHTVPLLCCYTVTCACTVTKCVHNVYTLCSPCLSHCSGGLHMVCQTSQLHQLTCPVHVSYCLDDAGLSGLTHGNVMH